MDRRTVLKGLAGVGSLAATGGLSMPALSQGAAARTLRFVPQANLANFDPIWGTQYVVRNAAVLVWDTLYGVDANLQPAAPDGRSRGSVGGRPDLDVPAAARPEIPRWRAGAGEGRGGEPHPLVGARSDGADAQGDPERARRRRRPHLQMVAEEAFPKMLLALGKNSTPMAFIMPERIAKTDPFKQITEYIGSGPMKFVQAANGCRAPRRCSRNSPTTCRGRSRPRGSPAARGCWSTASNGS